MKCDRELFFDAKEIIKQGPELKNENRSAITKNEVKEAVILYHYIDNYFY